MSKFNPMKRIVSATLAASLLLTQAPMAAYAEELKPAEDIYLPENTMDDVILQTDVFYMPSSTINLDEGSKSRYILRIGRGGDCGSEASVNVKIADLTAKYGKDYKISAIDGEEKVDDPDDNESLMERIEGEEYTATPMLSEEEFADKMEEDPALKEKAASAVNDMIAMVEDEADLLPAETEENDGETEAEPADGSESVNINPLLEAREKFTQVDGEPQRVTSTVDTYQQLQQIANVLTGAVVGANLRVNFPEGVSERFLAIDTIDNDEGDGDRYFYLMLSDPEGSTTVSAAATCAGTVADDEEQLPSKVSFGEVTVDSENNVVSVEVKREGALNTIADVQLKTEGKTAKLGRDISPVDMSVAFPIGVETRTVEIPFSTDNISDKAEFLLTLEENTGAEVTTAEKTVEIKREVISAEMGPLPVYMAGQEQRTLSTIKLDSAIGLSGPVKRDNDSHYTGNNHYDSNGWWIFEWIGGDGWTRFWHNYTGSVGAVWKLSGNNGFEYSGAQIDWERAGNCAGVRVGFEGVNGNNNTNAINFANGTEYSSSNGFGRNQKNIYSSINDPVFINIVNHGNCDDCNRLWIYSIKPIFRAFEIKLTDADKLKFLQEDGSSKVDDGTATWLALDGAANNSNNQIILFPDETVTFKQTVGKNISTPYTYLKSVSSTDGFKFADFSNNGSSSYSRKLDRKFINDNSTWDNKKMFKYYTNSYLKNSNPASGQYGTYGSVTLKPVFDYKNAVVKVNVPTDKFGYFNISGSDKNLNSSQEFTYHLGDTLRLSTKMDSKYSSLYKPAGYMVSYKQNKSDSKWIKQNVIVSYDSNGYSYLDDNKRLRYGYYEITPLFQSKGTSLTVRVKQDDLKNFDTSYGLFATPYVSTTTVSGVTYKDYAVYQDPTCGKIYSLTAKTKNDKTGIIWKINNKNTEYTGEVFYHEASNSAASNIITLSSSSSNSELPYHQLKGSLYKAAYNMVSKEVNVTNMIPVSGAVLSAGDSMSTTNAKGEFELSPFKGISGKTVRYIVSINGESILKEHKLSTAGAKQKEVTVVENNKPVTKKLNVVENSTGQLVINTENGGIIENIDVWADGMNSSGYSIIVDTNQNIVMKAKCRAPKEYKQNVIDANGKVSEKTLKENLTGVEFVVLDSNSYKVLKSYKASYDSKSGEFSASIDMTAVLPGQKLYMNITTDKATSQYAQYDSNGKFTGTVNGSDMTGMVYGDIYTGYSFSQKTTEDIPPAEQKIEPVSDIKFLELPLIGDSGFNFDFPFVSVSLEKTDTGYRMSIGVKPKDIADKIKGKEDDPDNVADAIKKTFSVKHPFDSFHNMVDQSLGAIDSLKSAAKQGKDGLAAARTASTALGSPTWDFDIQLGAYFDFNIMEVTNQTTGVKYTKAIFSGVGGYIAVSGGFKMTWYTILPVVYLPAYFGIEIEASFLGQFGASTDLSKPNIDYDEALNTSVDFGSTLGDFDMTLQLTGAVKVYVGVGIAGVLGLRGGGSVEVMGQYSPSDKYSDWGAMITFKAGIWIDLFLFTVPLQYTFPEIKFGSFKEIDDAAKGTPTTRAGELKLREVYTDKDSVWMPKENNIKVVPGVDGSADMVDDVQYRSGFSESSSYTIVSDGYEHPDTQLLKLSDGSVFMAFLDTSKGRDASERTVLKYSFFKDGKWTDPVAVNDNGTADFQPSICEMDNSKVMISWVSSDPEKEKSGEANDYLSSLEIYTAVIDKNANTQVSEITRLTEDEYYDYLPISVYDDVTGDRAVYYVKTASDGTAEEMVNSYTNDCVIVYMLCSDPDGDGNKRWLKDYYYDDEVENDDDRQELLENWKGQRFLSSPIPELGLDVPNIADMTATSYNGLAVFAYTIDQDSSNDTSFDKELFVQFYDFETHYTYVPVRVTDDEVADAIPQFVRVGKGEEANTMLFWYRNERIVAYIDVTDLVRNGVDEDGNIKPEYRQDANASAEEYIENLDRMYNYVETTSEGSQGNRSMSDFKAVVDNNNVYVVWTQAAENTSDEKEFCREVFATALTHPDDDTQIAKVDVGDTEIEDDENKSGSCWSNPYRLSYSNSYTDEPSVVIDKNGNMMAVYNQYNMEITEDPDNPLNISDFKLKASYLEPCGAVDVENISISNITPVKDETITVTAEVANNGLTFADGYTIEIFAKKADGTVESLGKADRDSALNPGSTAGLTVEWTAPESVDGIVFVAEAYEKGGSWTNKSTYESEPLLQRAEYTAENVSSYQSGDDFYVTYDITNTGNAVSTADDKYEINLVGPYGNTFGCTKEQRIFASESLEGIKVGETKSFTSKLKVPDGVFEKFGYVECLAAVMDKDENYRSEGAELRVEAVSPLNLKLNDNTYPEVIRLKKGETLKLDLTCSPASIASDMSAAFGVNDPTVAVVDGNTIEAVNNGTTILYGTADPYGTALPEIKVIVGNGALKGDISGNGVIDLYDAIEIAKYLVKSRTFTDDELEIADYNGDGKVTLYDAIAIAQYLVKKNK